MSQLYTPWKRQKTIGDTPLSGEFKIYGGSNIYYYTFIISFL